jgi:hypothetical protein
VTATEFLRTSGAIRRIGSAMFVAGRSRTGARRGVRVPTAAS